MIILLEDRPAVICQRLSERDSMQYSEEMIKAFLSEERTYAKEVAETLGIPLKYCHSETRNICIEELVQYVNSNIG